GENSNKQQLSASHTPKPLRPASLPKPSPNQSPGTPPRSRRPASATGCRHTHSAMAAAGAALRLRLLYRMLRVGELLALVVFLSWSSSRVPSAAAAVLRFAGSLLLNARFVFVLGNAIVLLLLALSRRDLSQ